MLRPSLILSAAVLLLLPVSLLADEPVVAAGTAVAAWATFLQSFGILFREGLEAMLLCTALAAATVRAGSRRGVDAIWRGAGVALLASLFTALLVDRVLDVTPASREAIEGLTMVLAAAVLFYVSYWLVSKLEVRRWVAYLERKVGRAESQWALGAVAFLAVYREGVETVLFYEALAGLGRPAPIWAGILAGAAFLGAVGFAVFRFGLRLPLRPLFAVTGGLLYLMGFVFVGQGVHELQEAGWLPETALEGMPRAPALGIHPTAETIAAQFILIGLAILAAALLLFGARSAGRRAGALTEPRREAVEAG